MKRFLLKLCGLVGIWLIISPWFLSYHFLPGRWYDLAAGVVILGLASASIIAKSRCRILVTWSRLVIGIAGIWLIVSGVCVLGSIGGAARWNEIVSGILLGLLAFTANQIPEGIPVRLHTKDGVVMVETSALERSGDDLVIRGKIMGAMSATMHIHPEEAWAMLGLITGRIIYYLPLFLFRGWRRRKKLQR